MVISVENEETDKIDLNEPLIYFPTIKIVDAICFRSSQTI